MKTYRVNIWTTIDVTGSAIHLNEVAESKEVVINKYATLLSRSTPNEFILFDKDILIQRRHIVCIHVTEIFQ